MAPVATQWKRLQGVVLSVTTGSFPYRSGDVKYTAVASYVMGGQGTVEFSTPIKPTRQFSDDDILEATAEVGDLADFSIGPDGTVKMFVNTEVWAEEDCP